jgi:[ribosomal protein S5]-alanine N-acetyltransferase
VGIPVLRTKRLELRPLDADDLDAMAAGDGAVLTHRLGAVFAPPVAPPPLFGDEISYYANRLRRHPEDVCWVAWLSSLQSSRAAVGVCGLGGGPDRHGVFTIGYSVYPAHQGNGYATEAMARLLDWAFGEASRGPRMARATIPPWNIASIRVAEKLGMTRTGTSINKEIGDVLLYDLPHPRAGAPPPRAPRRPIR